MVCFTVSNVKYVCLSILRSGHIVLVLLPGLDGVRSLRVAMVMACWVSQRKPKLATTPASLGQLVCLRAVIMAPVTSDVDCDTFVCTGVSEAWVLKPESIVAVLAPVSIQNDVSHCEVKLSEESMGLVRSECPGKPKPLIIQLQSITYNYIRLHTISYNIIQLYTINYN